jgi:hypothetical protein
MTNLGTPLALFLACGAMSAAALAGDLSRYRDFQFGTDLPTVAKQTGANPAQAKTIYSRPALIQELEWSPQPLGWASKTEPAQTVNFSFYNGELFRIAVDYDRNETEGLTPDDVVETLSAAYGVATRPSAPAKTMQGPNGEEEEVLAQWQDAQYRFDLIRSSYGLSFRLIGVLKRLEAPAFSATLEAKRLDNQEAPQRDAARAASEEQAAKARAEKARFVNKPRFRP